MNKISKKKLILPLLFCAFFLALSTGTAFGPKDDYSANEKRYLSKFPEISVTAITTGQFQDGLESYVCDHIPGRDFFVGVNSYFSLLMGRNTVSDIYNCKDGYLINSPKNTDTNVFKNNIKKFNSFTKMTGIPSTLLMIPNTGYIMDDVLPINHDKYIDDDLYKLADKLTSDMGIIDPREVLFFEKNNGQVFYRSDHHLTSFGNYIVYNLYCSVNGIACPKESKYNKKSYSGFYGTTWSGSGYWLSPPDNVELWNTDDNVSVTICDAGVDEVKSNSLFFKKQLKNKDKYPVFLDGNHGFVKIENPNAAEGSLLIIKDSYAQCFSTFLSHNYKTIYLIDLRYYRKSITEFLKENKADEILYMYGINTLITDTNSAWLN